LWSFFLSRLITKKSANINMTVFVAKIDDFEKSPFVTRSDLLDDRIEVVVGDRKVMRKTLENTNYDIIFSAGFPWLIPVSILQKKNVPSFNIHPSNLPKYWGPDPIRNQIISSVANFGVSIHYLSSKFDTGQIVYQTNIKNDHSMCVHQILYKLGISITPFVMSILSKDFNALSQKQKHQAENKLHKNDYAPLLKPHHLHPSRTHKNIQLLRYRLLGSHEWKDRLYQTV